MNKGCTIVMIAWAATSAWAGPEIFFEPSSIDLGLIEGDSVISFSHFIGNKGDETLHIDEVTVTCGCTVAILPDSTVEPGGTAPL